MKISEKILVICLLISFFVISFSSSSRKSLVFDEVQHMSSGYASFETGSLSYGLGHPPLFRLFIALPYVMIRPSYNKEHELLNHKWGSDPGKWSVNPDYSFGYELLYNSGNDTLLLIRLTRMMSIAVAVLLGLLIYAFTKEIYGNTAAGAALFFFSFSPNMIAHARYAVNDIAGALAILLVIYNLYRFLKHQNNKKLIILSLSCSLALLTKFNAIVPVLVVFIWLMFARVKRKFFNLSVFLVLNFFVINMFYGFKGTFKDDAISRPALKEVVGNNGHASVISWAYRRIPLPAAYKKSLFRLLHHNYRGHSAYFNGKYSRYGWWYYFPAVFLIKTPLITLFMFFAGLLYVFKEPKKILPGEKILLVFMAVFAVFAVNTKINIGLRHILPVYPMVFMISSKLFSRTGFKKYYIYSLGALYIISTQYVYPDYLPYANILTGQDSAAEILVDSNSDWGQDLPGLKDFLSKKGDPSLIMSYFGTASRSFYNITYQSLLDVTMGNEENDHINPYNTDREFLAVSLTNKKGVYYPNKDIFRWLEDREALKVIGHSIFVYDISRDIEATAIIAEIYIGQGRYGYAIRQYRRLLYLSSDDKIKLWASDRLKKLSKK